MVSGSATRRVSAYQTVYARRVDISTTVADMCLTEVNSKTQGHGDANSLVIRTV